MASHSIGLDIGTNAVRAVELGFGRGQPVVRRLGQVGLPAGAVVAGEIVDGAAVTAAIRRLWKEVGFASRSVVVGVANARVVARMAELPALPDEELRSSLRFQVQDLIPLPVDEAELDFELVEHRLGEDGQELAQVLLVAGHRDMLRTVADVVGAAGLHVEAIDLIPFALLRALHDPTAWMTDEDGTHDLEVIVGAGAGVTNVVVQQGGAPRFVRMLSTGSEAVTSALAEDLQVGRDEAEGMKRAGDRPAALGQSLSVLAWSPLDTLVNEVAGSIDFHLAQEGVAELRHVVVTGGGARLELFRSLLGERLAVPVVEAQPFRTIDTSRAPLSPDLLSESADLFTVATGLALRGAPGTAARRPITLVPGDVVSQRVVKRQKALVAAGIGGVVIALAGLTFLRSDEVDRANTEAAAAEARSSALQAEVAALQPVEQLQADIATRGAIVETVLQTDVDWPRVFHDVATRLPADVWLDSLSVGYEGTGPGTLQVTAKGFDHTSPANWLLRMAEVPALSTPWMSSASKIGGGPKDELVQFSANAELTPAAFSDRLARIKGVQP